MAGFKTKQSLFFLTVFVFGATGEPLIAQNQRVDAGARPNQTLWGRPKEQKTENVQVLKDSPDLPQLPSYSGKSKLYHGYMQPTERGWTNYQLTYLAKEPPQEVRDWYQNVFNSYQWKTLRAGRQTLSANHKDGHICTVIVNTTKEPGYKTQLALYYNQAPAKVGRQSQN